jgi:hypothetical protein
MQKHFYYWSVILRLMDTERKLAELDSLFRDPKTRDNPYESLWRKILRRP